jgi:hypothetical protein
VHGHDGDATGQEVVVGHDFVRAGRDLLTESRLTPDSTQRGMMTAAPRSVSMTKSVEMLDALGRLDG